MVYITDCGRDSIPERDHSCSAVGGFATSPQVPTFPLGGEYYSGLAAQKKPRRNGVSLNLIFYAVNIERLTTLTCLHSGPRFSAAATRRASASVVPRVAGAATTSGIIVLITSATRTAGGVGIVVISA